MGEQGASGGNQGRTAKGKQSTNGQPRSSQRGKSKEGRASPEGKRPSPTPQPQRSKVDAMGQDKHREVVGQKFGVSRGRQFLYYGIFVAFVVAAYIGLRAAADQLDKAPAHDPDQAPWSQPGAPQGPLGGFEPEKADQNRPTNFQ